MKPSASATQERNNLHLWSPAARPKHSGVSNNAPFVSSVGWLTQRQHLATNALACLPESSTARSTHSRRPEHTKTPEVRRRPHVVYSWFPPFG
jgi:hypothetical protein